MSLGGVRFFELVRVVLEALGRARDADQLQQLDATLTGGLLVHVHVPFERLGNLIADGQYRVERSHRILKDHGDPMAAHVAHLLFGQG